MAAPTGKGVTPLRSLRIADDAWEPAKVVARRNGETLTDVVVRALAEYVAADEAARQPKPKRNHSMTDEAPPKHRKCGQPMRPTRREDGLSDDYPWCCDRCGVLVMDLERDEQ